jgi:transposase-like protein
MDLPNKTNTGTVMPSQKFKRASTARARGASYPQEFKIAAVLMSRDPDIEVRHVARALRLHPVMLTQWRSARRSVSSNVLHALVRLGSKKLAAKLQQCAEQALDLKACKRQLKGKRHA